jgi:hypothetical protein
MKALTILQPYPWLIQNEYKRFETRGWYTSYRGPLAIHAGKRFMLGAVNLKKHGIAVPLTEMHLGAVVAIADLVECWAIDGYGHDLNWQPGDNDAESKFYYVYPASIREPKAEDFSRIRYPETMLGYYPDCGFKKEPRYAWELANVRPIEPVPAKGMQRLWEWEGEIKYV